MNAFMPQFKSDLSLVLDGVLADLQRLPQAATPP
jgi:hypothetical protein